MMDLMNTSGGGANVGVTNESDLDFGLGRTNSGHMGPGIFSFHFS